MVNEFKEMLYSKFCGFEDYYADVKKTEGLICAYETFWGLMLRESFFVFMFYIHLTCSPLILHVLICRCYSSLMSCAFDIHFFFYKKSSGTNGM